MRYTDPVMGPRSFPSADFFEKQQVPVEQTATLSVDAEKKSVFLVVSGKEEKIDLGNRLIYQV